MIDINTRGYWHIRQRYGLTKDQFIALYEEQQGLCDGCGQMPPGGGKGNANNRLFVDHNHKTGEVRGLLCQGCNASVGLAKDSPEVLRKLAKYLEKPPAYNLDEIIPKDSGRRMRDRTKCINGHEYTEENTRWRKRSNRENLMRECRTCIKVWESRRKPRQVKES